MSLSIAKCAAMYGGDAIQPSNTFNITDLPIPSVDLYSDLGILCSSDAVYSGQCVLAVSRGCKITGAIRKNFQLQAPKLLLEGLTKCKYA